MTFWEELQTFSDRFVEKHLGLPVASTPWHGGQRGVTRGAIIHYTADADALRVLRWFLKGKFESRVSANAVVFRERHIDHAELSRDLPLVAKLPATVVQCAPPEFETWHATWANPTSYGIENINIGELRADGAGGHTSWRPRDRSSPDWTTPWAGPTSLVCRRYWQPYTSGQLQANVVLLRELLAAGHFLDRGLILGHEAVQGVHTKGARGRDKRDPGPLYPIAEVRALAFTQDPLDGLGHRDIEREARGLAHGDVDEALVLLGYAPGVEARFVFQRMMGLHRDGIVGPKTRAALRARLEDRGIQ